MQTKVYSSELKIGMFVSSLDRPWIDTPFMLQGFLIESDEDIRLLRQYCEFVQVDWDMSPLTAPKEVLQQQAIKAAQAAALRRNQINAAQPVVSIIKANHVIEKSQSKSELFNFDSLADLTGKFKRFFKQDSLLPKPDSSPRQQSNDADDPPVAYKRPEFIPTEIPLSMYVDTSPVEIEVKPAVQAHTRANDVMRSLVKDIQSNKHFALEKTSEVVNEVVDSMVRNPDAMMWITRLRRQDETVYGHGLQVAVYLVALGRHLGLPKEMLERLCTMGLLLDIGKIKLPKTLLLKKGRLTTDEFELVKSHVQLSLDILKETPDLHPDVLQGIAQHHERENGSGYPAGLSKGEISLFGRMSAIADCFSALTNPRSYAETMPAYEALQTLSNFNPDLYQTTMIEQFIQAIGVFPVGSMVELSTGEVAVIIGHSKVRRLKPRVLIISDANKLPASQATTLDLLYQSQEAGQEAICILRGLPTGAFGLDAREYYLS